MPQGDDRLARLAEAHVVGKDGALAPEQERDAFDLMREEPLREPGSAPKRPVDIVWRERQQLGEGVSLSVEGSIHDFVALRRELGRPFAATRERHVTSRRQRV